MVEEALSAPLGWVRATWDTAAKEVRTSVRQALVNHPKVDAALASVADSFEHLLAKQRQADDHGIKTIATTAGKVGEWRVLKQEQLNEHLAVLKHAAAHPEQLKGLSPREKRDLLSRYAAVQGDALGRGQAAGDGARDASRTLLAPRPEMTLMLDQLTPSILDSQNALRATAGFNQLAPADQDKLMKRISGDREFPKFVRRALSVVLDEQFAAQPPEAQRDRLKKFLDDGEGIPDLVGEMVKTKPAEAQLTDQVSTPDAKTPFSSLKEPVPAVRTKLVINGHPIEIVVANTHIDHQLSLEKTIEALAALPPKNLALIKRVDVEPDRAPSDAEFAKLYGRNDFRAFMTAGSEGVVRIYPTVDEQPVAAIAATMIHETGHVLSRRLFGDSPDSDKWKAWHAAAKADGITVSKYAKSSDDEDFAETLLAYETVRGTPQADELKAMIGNRFALLQPLVG